MSGAGWSEVELTILADTRDSPMRAAQARLKVVGFVRSEQAIRLKRNRLWPEEGHIWPRSQTDYLYAHWRDGDAVVAVELGKIGPPRTVDAVKEKRISAGLLMQPSPSERRERLDWPVVASDPVEQDRNYIRALLADLRRYQTSTDSSPDHSAWRRHAQSGASKQVYNQASINEAA